VADPTAAMTFSILVLKGKWPAICKEFFEYNGYD